MTDDRTMDRLLRESEAAELLGAGKQTLTNWRSMKFGPDYIKLGRAVRYRESDLRKFIEGNLVRTEE